MFPINPPRALRTTTTAALYASDPDPDDLRGMLAAAAAVCAGHGWNTAPDGVLSDDCLISRPPQSRTGWARVREIAELGEISVVIVPSLGHISLSWHQRETERTFLRRHGVSVATVEPTLDAILSKAAR
ncbi:hypothetical protein ACFV2S_34400 [Streptomyces sp. NPDC059695]|uniref:hypothetical protein n=1 Tax=Streptomyces sp. NPDC059695 TaxID=3346910 RepID=UPI0036ACABA0